VSLTASERELMGVYGISAKDGGFSVRGFVFKTLDQAVSWAKRSGSSLTSEPRLPITAGDRFRWPVREPSAPPPPPPPRQSPRWDEPVSAAAKAAGKPRWVAGPVRMELGGISLDAEMIYVGKADRYAYPRNNALIDPTLPVSRQGDPQGTTLSYWGSYQDLRPTARRTFLEWLARGRSDPGTPIGYVFIFFYGLEWRLLHEGSREEAGRLAQEVSRLLEIYGSNGSFRSYAERFLDVALLLAKGKAERVEPSIALARHWEMPLRVRVYLGSLLAEEEPLDADAALLWVLGAPDTSLRTPASRCFEELRQLWEIRFGEAYPVGLSVRPPKARIKHAYRAASGGFTNNVSIDQLPDIGTVSAPLGRLRALLEACTDELDPLSRLLGRQPEARGSIAAAVVAPRPLLDGPLGEGLRICSRAIAERVGGQGAAIPAREVLSLLEIECPKPEAKVSAATFRQLAALLDSVGYGFEPDRRYGCSLAVTGNSKLFLFAAAGGGRVDPERPSYDAARTMIEIAALAALADGQAVPVELQSICRDLASLPDLDEVDRTRLAAHAEALLADPPKRKEAIARMAALPLQERRRVTQCAVAAILADGHVLPAEVRFLEHLHTALGLPQEEVYSALHRGSVEEDQPVRVTGAETAPDGRTGAKTSEVVRIDAARLERIRGETSAVSALLAGIFVEEEEARPAAPAPTPAVTVRFDGLDAAHAELLWVLVQRPLAWDEFEEQAKGAKLLPAGAIETINEWGFEMLGEPVIEEEDPVGVASHLAEQLAAMGAQA
jgi:tellurite resistance protein